MLLTQSSTKDCKQIQEFKQICFSMVFFIADFSQVFCTNVETYLLGLRLKSVTKILRFSNHALLFDNGYTFACLLLVSTAFYNFSRLGVRFTKKKGGICGYFWATQIFFRTFLWKCCVNQLLLSPTVKKMVNLGVEGNVLWTLHRSSMGNMTDFILLLYSSYSYAVLLFCDSFWSLGFQLWGGGGGGWFYDFWLLSICLNVGRAIRHLLIRENGTIWRILDIVSVFLILW